MQNQISFCDILARYGEGYISRNRIKGQEKGIIRLLSACRSSALGSHFKSCSQCSYYEKAYNSCRNRHCTLCQNKDKLQWLNKRMEELLPIGYYHLVFTIPHQLNYLCLMNKKVIYNILFKAASQTLLSLCKDPKHMGADTGLITVLHTWGQNLKEHPHLHCIMPSGGLSFDKQHWVHIDKKDDFFIHFKVISNKFRGIFLELLTTAFDNNQLIFKGKNIELKSKQKFSNFTYSLKNMNWVVNIQKPFGKPENALEYLSRYIFRIAITDRRIKEIKNGKVLFTWKDYRTGHYRKMELEIDEFIRRFLLHVLPKGFLKVRYYGIFTNRYRKENIENSKNILDKEKQNKLQEDFEDGVSSPKKQHTFWDIIWPEIKQYKKPNCPACKKGRLRFAGIVPKE